MQATSRVGFPINYRSLALRYFKVALDPALGRVRQYEHLATWLPLANVAENQWPLSGIILHEGCRPGADMVFVKKSLSRPADTGQCSIAPLTHHALTTRYPEFESHFL
jgi:hypothetical protein